MKFIGNKMIQYTKTESVFFEDTEKFEKFLDDSVASDKLKKGTATGIKMSGVATKQTSVGGMPAVETHTVVSVERLNMANA